jgi:Zn-dependent metalloprotease
MHRRLLGYGVTEATARILHKMLRGTILLAIFSVTAIPSRAQLGDLPTAAPISLPCGGVKPQQTVGIPIWLRWLSLDRASQDPVESALAALRANKALFCAWEEDDFRFTGRMEKEDQFGLTTVRVGQTYRGLEVVQQELIVHMTRDSVVMINGRFIAGISVPTEPCLLEKQAEQIAVNHIVTLGGINPTTKGAGSLVVFVNEQDKAYLAYPVTVDYRMKRGNLWENGPHSDKVFVDAITGEVVGRHPQIRTGIVGNQGVNETAALS